MIAPGLLLDLYIRPACTGLAAALGKPMHTPAAPALLLRTAAVESGFGVRRQHGAPLPDRRRSGWAGSMNNALVPG